MAIMVTKKPPAYLREARVKAGYVSRGTASIAVPYSPETIGRHERGEVDLTPADAVVYAESYKSRTSCFATARRALWAARWAGRRRIFRFPTQRCASGG